MKDVNLGFRSSEGPNRINSRKIIPRHKIINEVGFILGSKVISISKK